jgi:acyl-CoA synthetase (AMP-forming)/AMP-acid ligase II
MKAPGTIGALVADAALRFGDREFLRFPGESLSFAEVDAITNRLARVLIARGLRKGDRAAIMMDNVAGWPLCWIAITKAGGVAVPVNARYRESDLGFVLRDSGAVMALTIPEHAELIRAVAPGIGTFELAELLAEPAPAGGPSVAVEPVDLANLQYTSGTTGFPKACMLTHEYWLRLAALVAEHAELHSDDVMLIAQAFSYMDPQWVAVMCLFVGAPLVVLPRFSASGFWRSAREHGATVSYVLGSMPLLLFKQPEDPADRDNRMRLVLCSGIAPDLHAHFERRWGAVWRELYGSTESGLDLIVPASAGETVGTGAMGHPPQGKEVIVADAAGNPVPVGDVGEILIRGGPMMLGYWNHPDITEHVFRGGWFHTGDLGFADRDGYIHHAGRIKDVIRRGGENISATEVEHVLHQHPSVLAAAVVGIPDQLFGELPEAFIQLRPGEEPDTATASKILAYVREQLARFKVPAYLKFVDSFPMTPSARIRKSELVATDPRVGAFDAATETWSV